MNTNDLLAAPTGHHAFGGVGILVILAVLALGYGVFRLTRRVRLNRQPRPTRPRAARPQ